MKTFLLYHRNRSKGGFNLVEAMFSVSIFSFGFLALIPLLALGSKTARGARNDRATTQIAEMLIEQAKQGALSASPIYLDAQGNVCSPTQAIYMAQTVLQPIPGNATTEGSPERLTLRIAPTGAPARARTYAVVLSTP